MRGQLPASLFAIVFGAFETVGGVQELIYRGILRSETEPLVMGTIGTLAGIFLLVAGILLLIRSPHAAVLAQSAAYIGVPVFLIIGVWKHYAGWPITLIGIAYPLLLVALTYKSLKNSQAAHA
ncbi:MAG: hypothetical protein JSS69_06090 [Acidobacteria bacterium]|nr:hypothetical protein [Acidobacteriota bacterium]MBS1865472.1 hypothetical protein [Acidobacteriota bacterium]